MSESTHAFSLPGAINLVFTDGVLDAEQRRQLGTILPEGVSLSLAGGPELRLAEGVELARPIHLAHLRSPSAAADEALSLETRVIAAAGSRATLVESYSSLGDDALRTAHGSTLHLGEGTKFDHVKLQREALSSTQHATSQVIADAHSRYRSHEINFGGVETHRQLELILAGEGAHCELFGLNLASGAQRMESRTRVTHASVGCETNEVYKAIAGDEARALFDGLILVKPDAQVTRAYQSNRNLLLSDRARITSMPRLEIYADDVRCSHGSTTGELDAEQLFYLQTRGFTPEAARALLVHAFASEVLETVEFAALREWLTAELLTRLPGGALIGEAA